MPAKAQSTSARVRPRVVKAVVKDQPLVAQRRDRLIAAAIDVFKHKGFDAASVRDIGRKAGMTQGTIYNYVASKDDVLYLVCDRLVTQYQDETRKALASEPDPVLRVRSAARALTAVIYDHQDEILLIYQNSHLLDAKSLRVILQRVDGFVRLFEELIAGAAKEAAIAVPDPYFAANVFTFLPTIVALRRWSLGKAMTKDDLLDSIADVLIGGLGFCHAYQPRAS
jgi:AcrR family transcriptional regulator